MTRFRYSVWFVLYFVLGCASTAPVPEDRFYQLDISGSPTTLTVPVLRGGLNVDYVTADPLRNGRAVLYRDAVKPLELQRYHYEFWVDHPPRMVHRALLQYLRSAGVADAVVDGSDRTDAAHRLRIRLLKFEQVLGPESQGIEVELEISLYSESTGSVEWAGVYLQRQDSGSRDIHATARAMQKALEQIFRSLVVDLEALDSKT